MPNRPATRPAVAGLAIRARGTFMASGHFGKECVVVIPSLGIVAAAYNTSVASWGDTAITDPPNTNSILNQNLRLLTVVYIPHNQCADRLNGGYPITPIADVIHNGTEFIMPILRANKSIGDRRFWRRRSLHPPRLYHVRPWN